MSMFFDPRYVGIGLDCGDPSHLRDVDPLTVCAWIHPYDWGSNDFGRIVAKEYGSAGWLFFLNDVSGNDTISFQRYRATTDTYVVGASYAITLNVWQHVAVTYQSSSTVLYVNGVAISNSSYTVGSGSIVSDHYDFLYIANREARARGFHGVMEDVRVYGRYLSAGEIGGIYAARGHDTIWQSRLGHWRLREEAPGVPPGTAPIKDITSYLNHAYSYYTGSSYTFYGQGVIAPHRRRVT